MEKPFRFLVNDIVILKHSKNYYNRSVCTGDDISSLQEDIGGYYYVSDCYYNCMDDDNNNELWDCYHLMPLFPFNDKECIVKCNGKCLEFVEDQEKYKTHLRNSIV